MSPSPEAFPTLSHALRQRAVHNAEGLALRFLEADGETTLSYGELDSRARAIAVALRERLVPGERAVLVFHSGPDYVAAFFGCLYAGIIAVPAYPPTSGNAQHQRRLLSIIEDSEPGLLLTSTALLAELPPGVPGLAVDTLGPSAEEAWTASLPEATDIAFLQYTSGSTSLPKGVMVSHANLVANEALIRAGFGIGPDDVIVSWLPLYHDMGLIGGLLQPIYSGIPCVLMSPRYFLERPVRWLEAISTYGGTISGGPDFAYRLCRERISPSALAGLDLSHWRVAYSGSEPIRQASLEGFAGHVAATGFAPGSFFACYGLAEATLFVTGGRRGEGIGVLPVAASALSTGTLAAGDDALAISCGRAQPGHGVRIVAPLTLEDLPAGTVGEIWASGPSIAVGYWRNPEASATTFVEHDGIRWLRTGDLGALQGDELYVTGRLKDLLIVRGQNLYPQDLEQVIEATVEGIREGRVAAFAVPDGDEEGIGIACEIGRGTRKRLAAEGLIEAIRCAVAGVCQQAPAFVALLEPGGLPKTSSGKLQRSACWPQLRSGDLQPYACFPNGETAARSATGEVGELTTVLADIWRSCLGGVAVGPEADFFLLGGNSISATQVIGETRRRLGRAVELRTLFEAPRLTDFAAQVAASPQRREPAAELASGERLPLSAAQRRLWLAWQLDPAGAAYSIPGGLSLRGEVDAQALQIALDRLVARHDSLRSRFFEADGQAWQRIDAGATYGWQVLDLRSLPEADRERALGQRRDAEAREPFDLVQGPLLRVSLVRLDDDAWQLWLTVHHIVADGWSLNLLLDEFARLYAEACGGQPAQLASLPCRSVQAVLDQESRQAEWQASHLAWWRQALGEMPESLGLPSDGNWDARRVSPAERLSRRVEAELAERLRQAAQARGASPFMWLLATFGLLLHRHGGARLGCLGVPSANRLQADTFGQVGCFINTLVFPLRLEPAESFIAQLARVRDFTLDAQAHQALPYDDLAASYGGRELFRVLFNHQQRDLGALRRLPGLLAEPLAWHSRQAKFELQLQTEEDERGRLSLHFDFALDAWDRATIERLADAYLQLLAATVAEPERPVGELPSLSEAEGQRVLLWGEAPCAMPEELLPAGLERALRAHPDRQALEWDGGQLDHRHLHAAARRLATRLLAAGAGPDVPVAICAERSPERVVGLLAIVLAGSAYVPLDPDYPRDRLDFMLTDSAAPLLLCQGDPAQHLTLPTGVQVLRLDDALVAGDDVALPPPALHPEHLAYILYTSGSTGRPKGVGISHGALAQRLTWMQATYALDASDVLLQKAPLGFDVSVWETFWPLLAGARLVLAAPGEQRDPAALLQRVRAHGVTTLHFVPPLLQLFLDQPGVAECTSLRRLFSGGEALPAALRDRVLERLPAVALHNRYGPTETTINATHWRCRVDDGPRVPIGTPLGNVRCRVLDGDLNLLPIRVAGELCVAGAGLARGYLGRPALTAERFVPDPFGEGGRLYRTGDRVCWDAEGRLDYLGRLDDQLKLRGFRIEPGEIRQRLLARPGVAQAAVALRETAGGPQLLGYVTCQAGVAPLEPTQLRQALATELPDYLVPAQVLVLDAMPLTPNGKLDTQALPLPERATATTTPPQTHLQRQIAAIWSEVLGIAAIGLEDDFFALGGHSLLATQIVSRVRLACDVDLSLRTLFAQPTLAGFAAEVERLRANGALDRLGPILPVDRRRPVPLSPSQQRMWFLWQLDPSSPAYNVGGMARLVGVLDIARFEAALQALIQRHEALRTLFPSPDGTPIQRVQAELLVPLEWHDHSRLPAAESEAALLRLADEEAHRPFDLERGPLLRALLVKQAEREHHLVLTLHHIVTEGWAMDIFARELGELYEAFLDERESPLVPLPVQYLDYSEWQRQWLDGGERVRQLDYWREQLGDEHPLLELPSDRPRPPVQSHRGALHRFSLPPEVAQRVRAFNARQGLTLFMTCTAALAALLHRYSGQTDLRIGMPVANRIRPESEGLIGAFLNTQVLRCRLDGQMTVRELLSQVRETVIEAQAHQDLPFDQLVEALQPLRSPAYNPLFQVMCNVQRWAFQQTRTLGGLTVEYRLNDARATKFDLNLEVTDFDERLGCCLTYSQDLFDEPRISAMADHWQALLEALQGDPQQRLCDLPLLSAQERAAQLAQLSGEVSRPATTLDALFARQVVATPEAAALTFAGETLTYAELDARANRLARALIARGVRPGMRIGLGLPRSLDLVSGLLGILKAGAAYVPLDPGYPVERLSYLLADSGVRLVLGNAALRERLEPLPASLIEGWLDPASVELDEFVATPVAGLSHPALPAYVIYTSGSTGQPKGVVVAHGEIADHCQAVIARFGLREDDCELHFYSINFDAASERLLTPLLCGARVVLRAQGQWDPESICALIKEEQVTILGFTPSYGAGLGQWLAGQGRQLPVRLCITGGEALTGEHLQRIRRGFVPAVFFNAYGPTETVVMPVAAEAPDALPTDVASVPIGRLLGARRAAVLDAHLALLPEGALGELFLGGACLAQGYHQRPGLTAERFVPDPFAADGGRLYRSGDRVRLLADGQLEYVGRLDHQVKIRGFRIELGEIEARLREQPGVDEAVVLALDGPAGKQLVAYLGSSAATAGAESDWLARLRSRLAESLTDYMIPALWVVLPALPLTANGKLDRQSLPAPAAQTAEVSPASALEATLSEVWAQVLQVPSVGVEDNFFERGGDSILSIQLVSRARERDLHFTPRDVFQHQTVRRLAAVTRQQPKTVAVSGPAQGTSLPTPIQQWFLEQSLTKPDHWNQAVLLIPREVLDAARLAEALQALAAHHDALRLRYVREGAVWHAAYAASVSDELLWQRQVSSEEECLTLCESAQRSLDLAVGPLLRAMLVEGPGTRQRLLLACHHLVVDGVSWRILLEDLQRAYRGQTLPARTSPPSDWAARLHDYAQSESLREELALWREQLGTTTPSLKYDRPTGSARAGDAAQVSQTLDTDLTRQLLQEAPAAYRTQVNDLLLSALARVLCRWLEAPAVPVQLEGHGREALFDDLDLTRSVGWFTAAYPVRLMPAEGLGATIQAIKAQLRAVPHKGLGYGVLRYLAEPGLRAACAALPEAAISFNYLGQFDQSFTEDSLFTPAAGPLGALHDPDAPLPTPLAIDCQVQEGRLGIRWTYSREQFDQDSVAALADAFNAELALLVEHCLDGRSGGCSPTDFPLACLSQAQLDALAVPARRIEDIYPLTPMQEGLLLHTLLEPGQGLYFMQDRYRIDSALDHERFAQAWSAVVARHEALRASFVWNSGETMLQVIQRPEALDVEVLDWRGRNAETQERSLHGLLEQERLAGFALLERPPFHLRLIRLAEARYWFIMSNHHILIDAWCRGLLMSDFLDIYAALGEGRAPALAPAPRYRDYIAWLQRQDHERSGAWWRANLAGLERPTELPCDRPPLREHAGADGGMQVGDRQLRLAPTEGARLRELAQRHGLTVNTLAQAAWALVLHRYSGDDDLLFGVTVAGRPLDQPEMQRTVGLFINSVPLRVRLPGVASDTSVLAWLRALLEANLALREHEYLPLVEIQEASEVPKGQPLFDSLFVFENAPVDAAVLDRAQGLRATSDSGRTHTNFPLTVVCYPGDDLGLHLSYDRRYFDARTIERLLADFRRLLLAVAAGIEGRFAELALGDPAEHAFLLEHCNASARDYPLDQGYVRLFEAQVSAHPQRIAAQCGPHALSYAELNLQANRLGHRLRSVGIGFDDPVALLAERDLPLLGMMVGSFKAGAGYLPLDPTHPEERLGHILALSRARVLVCSAGCRAQAEDLLEQLACVERPRLLVWEDVQAAAGSVADLGIYSGPQHLAYIIYTSGSTGTPKGVMVEQAGMLNNQLSKVPYLGLDERDAIAQTASQSFDISVWQFLAAPLFGGRTVIVPTVEAHEPSALLAQVAAQGISVLESVPALIQGLLESERPLPAGLRWLLPTGEAMPPALARQWLERHPGCGLVNAYGPAECADDVAFHRVLAADTRGSYLPIGAPTDNNRLYLWGAQGLVPRGAIGELCVAGIGVGRGYLGDPQRTALAFVPHPWGVPGERLYRTGDLARRRADGLLEYVGRRDHQVKLRGLRIELGEIEARLHAQPSVREAAVTVLQGPHGPYLQGYLVAVDAELAEEIWFAELRDALRRVLPDYMVPVQWLLLERLPRNANGKLDRRALPVPSAEGASTRVQVEPATELERDLARIWAEVLKLERVGVTDNFFELGGHSLLATQIASRVQQNLQRTVPLRAMFECSTVRALAEYLEREGQAVLDTAQVERLDDLMSRLELL